MQPFHRSQWVFWSLWSLLTLAIIQSSTTRTSRTQLQDRKFEDKHSNSWSYRITKQPWQHSGQGLKKEKHQHPYLIVTLLIKLFWSLNMTTSDFFIWAPSILSLDRMTFTCSGSLRLEKMVWKRRTNRHKRWKYHVGLQITEWRQTKSWIEV